MDGGVRIGRIWVMFCIGILMAFASLASAVEVAGVKLDDTVRVGDQELKLNGAGIRYKVVFKVYVAGLYLTEKKSNLADVLAVPGAKRITLVMLRDIESESLGQAFMDGLRKNNDLAERTKIINQELIFGRLFASIPELKKGDVLTTDWIPGSGTICHLNGKKVSEFIPDVLFYNALLKIWLGRSPPDVKLKAALFGENP